MTNDTQMTIDLLQKENEMLKYALERIMRKRRTCDGKPCKDKAADIAEEALYLSKGIKNG